MAFPASLINTALYYPYPPTGGNVDVAKGFLDEFKNQIKLTERDDELTRNAIHMYYLGRANISRVESPNDPTFVETRAMVSSENEIERKLFEDAFDFEQKTAYPNEVLNFQELSNTRYAMLNMDNVESEYTWVESGKLDETREWNCDGKPAGIKIKYPVETGKVRLERIAHLYNTPLVNFQRLKIMLKSSDHYRNMELFLHIFSKYLGVDVLPIQGFENVPFIRTEYRDGVAMETIVKGKIIGEKIKTVPKADFPVTTTYKVAIEFPFEFDDMLAYLDLESNVEPYMLLCTYLGEDYRVGINHKGLQIELERPETKTVHDMVIVTAYLRYMFYKYRYTMSGL